MLLSGFTVIRNAELMGYPIVESIRSLLPIVDEYVVGVGQSDDSTKALIQSIASPKIKIFDSIWDTSKTTGGLILSEKTNEALDQCQGDWCFYLQADEVVHEDDIQGLRKTLENISDKGVEGLLFDYLHFYGAYNIIGTARNWYRREVRIIRKSSGARSYGDAQGFKVSHRKPRVAPSGARIFHYGWVKEPKAMGQKNKHMFRWWHGEKYDNAFDNFSYEASYGLRYFNGTHPLVMNDLVKRQSWQFDLKNQPRSWNLRDLKNMLSDGLESLTGYRMGEHRNYELIKSQKES